MRWWRDFRAQLALVVFGAITLRLVAVLTWSRYLDPQGDQNVYWRQGQDLAQWFGFVYRNNFGERIPTAVHPPLYSSYLGVVGFLGGDSHAAQRVASAFLGGLAVAVIGLAARKVAGNRVGILAAVLAAIYPNLWVNDVQLQSETMYALTVGLLILASYRLRERLSYGNAAFLGLTIGLAALARAEALALFVLLAVPLVLLRREKAAVEADDPDRAPVDVSDTQFWANAETGGSARWRVLGTVFLVGALVLAPWVIRNLLTFEKPSVMSSGAGFVLEISNCDQTYGLAPPVDADGNPQPGTDADTFLGYWSVECDRTPWPAGDETVVEAAKRQTGVDYMSNHRSQLPKVLLARVGRIWDVWRPGQSHDLNVFFERRGDLPTTFGMAQYYLMLPFALAGLVSMWRRRITIIPFVAIAISVTLTAAVSFGITRYRVGADVAICILAAVGIDALIRLIAGRRAPAVDGSPDDLAPDGDDARAGAGPGAAPGDETVDAADAGAGDALDRADGRPVTTEVASP